jgi:hypothetical protein
MPVHASGSNAVEPPPLAGCLSERPVSAGSPHIGCLPVFPERCTVDGEPALTERSTVTATGAACIRRFREGIAM